MPDSSQPAKGLSRRSLLSGAAVVTVAAGWATMAKAQSGLAPIKWRGVASTDRLFFELCGAEVVERGIAPNGVAEAVDVSGSVPLGIGAGEEGGPPDRFGFQRLEERLDHRIAVAMALSGHRYPEAVAA